MPGILQVKHNYGWLHNTKGWGFYTLGPFQGEGWLYGVWFAHYAFGTDECGWSLSLIRQQEASEASHTSGVNLLGPGGHPEGVLGDWLIRRGRQLTQRGTMTLYPMWSYLQGGSQWVSVAFQGLRVESDTWSWAVAMVVQKEFMDGLAGFSGVLNAHLGSGGVPGGRVLP